MQEIDYTFLISSKQCLRRKMQMLFGKRENRFSNFSHISVFLEKFELDSICYFATVHRKTR